MVAFVTSTLVLIFGGLLIIWYGRRRPVDQPLTWGEAFVAGTYVFFLLFWAYGVVPHQWLVWADNELSWRADKILHGPGGVLKPIADGGWVPFTITYSAIRDIIATGIYIVFLGAQIWFWIWWQKRGEVKPKEVEASRYGRPLVRPAEQAS